MLKAAFFAVVVVAMALPATGTAQNPDISREIVQSQRRLEQIREERNRLRLDLGDVRNRVRDAATELANVERRLSATRS
ncbi:MAG: hypothetical protein P8L45_11595, partial [Longimicrobiales bacterium]|nr:hypothetical protein [Longimicrobiales bacterium]